MKRLRHRKADLFQVLKLISHRARVSPGGWSLEPVFLTTTLSSFSAVRALLGPSKTGGDHLIRCEVLFPRTQKFLFRFPLFV